MARSSRSAERFKYGICLNDECPLCKEKKVQQVPMRKELVCQNPECGKPLRECPPPPKGLDWKKIGAIIAGVAVLGGGGYALSQMGGESEEPQTTPQEQVDSVKPGIDSTKVETPAEPQKEETKAEKVKEAPKAGEVKKAPESQPKPKANPTYGTVNLGYGTYTGDLKDGQPHGHGTITYKSSRKVVSWNDAVAQPGDKFEGDFRNGAINGLGYLKTRDGNVVAIQ